MSYIHEIYLVSDELPINLKNEIIYGNNGITIWSETNKGCNIFIPYNNIKMIKTIKSD